jgi:bacterioferritin-associated ferredoxin
MDRDDVVVCRCEEATLEEIRACIGMGYRSFDEIKRVLRVGMGPCQGRGCRDIVMREISRASGEPLETVSPGTIRPPVKPIMLGLLASGAGEPLK